MHFSAWLSSDVFSQCFSWAVWYLCRNESSYVCSFAQECPYVLLLCLLNVRHSKVSFAILNNNLYKQVQAPFKAGWRARLIQPVDPYRLCLCSCGFLQTCCVIYVPNKYNLLRSIRGHKPWSNPEGINRRVVCRSLGYIRAGPCQPEAWQVETPQDLFLCGKGRWEGGQPAALAPLLGEEILEKKLLEQQSQASTSKHCLL